MKTAARRISSAFYARKELLESHYDPSDWNTYLFHFSDGDNSSDADNRSCVKILEEELLPICNMFGYCQVTSRLWKRGALSTC
ncbi:MAG: DUF444 family protein [Phycisphaerales bacterium]